MADKTTERLALLAETEPVPYTPGDLFPVHGGLPKGYSDLNQHTLDLLDEGKPELDPFKTPGSIPGEATPPRETT